MPAKLPTGKKIDKPAGFPGFRPVLMLKETGSTETIRTFKRCFFWS
jgi:hypothetical protein